MTFKKYLKHTNYECDLTGTQKEEGNKQATDCHICGMTFDDQFWIAMMTKKKHTKLSHDKMIWTKGTCHSFTPPQIVVLCKVRGIDNL